MRWCVRALTLLLGASMLELVSVVSAYPFGNSLGFHARAVLWSATLVTQLVAIALWVLADALHARRSLPTWVSTAALCLVFGIALWPVATSLTSGDWIRHRSYVAWLRFAIVVVPPALAALYWGLWKHMETSRYDDGPRPWVAGLSAIAACAIAALNVTRLQGLYPAAHLTAMLAAAWLAVPPASQLAEPMCRRLQAVNPSRWQSWLTCSAALTCAASLTFGVLAGDSVKAELSLRSARATPILPLLPSAAQHSPVFDTLASLDQRKDVPEFDSGPSELRIPADWNVVIFLVDALRSDALQAFRRPGDRLVGDLAPHVDQFLKQAVVFRTAYSAGTLTRVAMPSLLRSIQPFADLENDGTPLPVRMADSGRTSVAVVPSALREAWVDGLAGLFDGFDFVSVYGNDDQNRQPELIRSALESVQNKPFFAWFHHFGVHDPGWAGERLDGAAHVWMLENPQKWPDLYPRALQWMDLQFARLLADLRDLGIAEKTVVVLAADHGEGLGDHGSYVHGMSVFDELSRVPLAFYIPGQRGHSINHTVGNIDIAPTLAALCGAPARRTAGTSLLPLIVNPDAQWQAPTYYISSAKGVHGAVRGRLKYVVDTTTAVDMFFDLNEDPRELRPILQAEAPSHRRLVSDMVRLNPSLFAKDLESGDVTNLLDRQLQEVDVAHPPHDLPLLLDLIGLAPTSKRLQWAEATARNGSCSVAAHVVGRLQGVDEKRFNVVAEEKLRDLAPHEAAQFAAVLAENNAGPFAVAAVLQELETAAHTDFGLVQPWLSLTRTWRLSAQAAAPAALAVFATAPDSEGRRDAMEWFARADGHVRDESELLPYVLEAAEHEVPAVRAAAALAAGRLRGDVAAQSLRTALTDDSVLVRGAALRGLGALLGEDALPDVERVGKQPLLTSTAVDVVESIGSPRGIGFLRWAKAHGASRFQVLRAYRKLQRR